MDKGKRKEAPTSPDSRSIVNYLKTHASYSAFNSFEFLQLLNCDRPEEAREEAQSELNHMLSFPHLNKNVKTFIGKLLSSNLDILSNKDAELYWREKANMENIRLNAHAQLNVYNSTVSQAMQRAALPLNTTFEPSGSGESYGARYNEPSLHNNTPDDVTMDNESVPTRLNQYWLDLMENSRRDNSLHKYSGLKNNIIIIGQGIKNNARINDIKYNELLCKLEIGQVKRFSVHKSLITYYSNILDTDDLNSLEVVARLPPAIDFTKVPLKKELFLIQDLSMAVLSLLNNIKLACKEEKSYRAYFVHPVCTAIANYVNTPLDFLPAEATLLSMSKFLRNKNMIKNDRESYKADGIFQYNKFEIGIVEISGPFGNPNRSKFQFDFHKAMYGCMSIMWDIVNTYHYGTIQTFEELEIHFIHSKVTSMQLWSMKFDENMFVMHRKRKAIIADSIDCKSQCIHHLLYFAHTAKVKFEQTIITINKLKKEHNSFVNKVLSGENQKSDRVDLRDVVKMMVFKLSEANDSAGLCDADPTSIGEFDEETLSFLETL